MNTNWSSPRTNMIAGIMDLRQALAGGCKARLVRIRNEDCQHPIKEKTYHQDFRCYNFSIGYASTAEHIKTSNYSEFEKYLSLNYVSVYGTEEAMKRYYETGVCSADNFKSMGYNHLVKASDYIKFLNDIGDHKLANIYSLQYLNPDTQTQVFYFNFFSLKKDNNDYNIKKFRHKLWVVELLKKDDVKPRTPLLLHILAIITYPLKYVPRKSVLHMPSYTTYNFRIGDVINGCSVEFQIPKKFSF